MIYNVYLIKNDLVKGTGQSLQDLKYILFYLERIQIERQENDSWKVIHYNRSIYKDKTPKELFGYTNEFTKDEVFDDIDTKSLAKKLGYKIVRDL